MRLNRASDFALRILMLLAKEDRAHSVEAIAARLGLAKSHVMKIVAKLGAAGFVETQKGRRGGVKLGREPEQIAIGSVVRTFENDFAVVECLRAGGSACNFLPRCALKPAMVAATEAFLRCLDGYTLARIVAQTQPPHPSGPAGQGGLLAR